MPPKPGIQVVRPENPTTLVTGVAEVPAGEARQVIGADPGRDTITVVNEGTVDVFFGGSREQQDGRIPTGGERQFTTGGGIYMKSPAGGANGLVRWHAETFG